ncbi:MAG: hypothetical protein NTY32_03925, partial [Bacteroidia bacterium]|nr:hypothetical protein [Bacteroidia bacterium]
LKAVCLGFKEAIDDLTICTDFVGNFQEVEKFSDRQHNYSWDLIQCGNGHAIGPIKCDGHIKGTILVLRVGILPPSENACKKKANKQGNFGYQLHLYNNIEMPNESLKNH